MHKHKFKLYGRSPSGFTLRFHCHCGRRVQYFRNGIFSMLLEGGKLKDSFYMGAW